MQLAVLDLHGECCESGKIDACGICDGSALAVDVEGVCCGSGISDAAGFCCASGQLDECGICDGDSDSCALQAVVDVQANNDFIVPHLVPSVVCYQMPHLIWSEDRFPEAPRQLSQKVFMHYGIQM